MQEWNSVRPQTTKTKVIKKQIRMTQNASIYSEGNYQLSQLRNCKNQQDRDLLEAFINYIWKSEDKYCLANIA